MHSKKLHMVTFLLLVVGGLNWLLHGLFGMNVVYMLFGSMPILERTVYVLVGLSAVYELMVHKSSCVHCGAKAPVSSPGPGE